MPWGWAVGVAAAHGGVRRAAVSLLLRLARMSTGHYVAVSPLMGLYILLALLLTLYTADQLQAECGRGAEDRCASSSTSRCRGRGRGARRQHADQRPGFRVRRGDGRGHGEGADYPGTARTGRLRRAFRRPHRPPGGGFHQQPEGARHSAGWRRGRRAAHRHCPGRKAVRALRDGGCAGGAPGAIYSALDVGEAVVRTEGYTEPSAGRWRRRWASFWGWPPC